MSCGCMYILRNAKDLEKLCSKLICIAKEKEYGLCFNPINNLLIENSVNLNSSDFAFEVCDSFNSDTASLLLCYEEYSINGMYAKLPLLDRLQILQNIASTCIPHTETLEIYIGEDTPYLPDYSCYRLAYTDIKDTLYKEYQLNWSSSLIPCVHLIINK